MTATHTPSADVVSSAAPDSPRARPSEVMLPPAHDRKLVWRWFAFSAGLLLLAYLLLLNPYWVPGGDSDFYVAIARNLALHGTYEYNGLPVAISPPGWPWVMAVVLKLSPTFLALKTVTMLSMWGSLLISYFIAIRFVPPRLAALSVVLAGVLMPVYSLTYFLHSEGLYCLLSAAALLMAFRIRERRGRWLESIALIALCVAIPWVRWAGVFQLVPIAAVLLSGRWGCGRGLLRSDRRWLVAGLCSLAIICTWLGTRWSLELTAEQQLAIKAAGGSAMMDEEVAEELPTDAQTVAMVPTATSEGKTLFEEYSQRFLRAGKWFSWFLWQPSRFVTALGKVDILVTLAGWVVIAMLAYVAIASALRGQYLWIALAIYCGGLCMNWPNPNSRYFVPVAPLIVLGLLLATRMLHDNHPSKTIDWWKWLRRGIVYSILAVNLLLYGVDLMVMRSSNFYATFEAGQHKDLINIAHYLQSLPKVPDPLPEAPLPDQQWSPRDGEIMINERYENLGKVRFSKAGMRAMVLLTDTNIKPLEKGLSKNTDPPFSRRVPRAMKRLKTDWLLVQSPTVPWRLWHFRLPMSLHDRFTKYPGRPESGGWTLYHYYAGDLFVQPVPDVEGWPKRVPGM